MNGLGVILGVIACFGVILVLIACLCVWFIRKWMNAEEVE